MVYVNLQDTAPAIYVPLNGWPFGFGTAVLSVKNTTDGRVLELPISQASPRGFLVLLQVVLAEGFGPGEWEYRLTANAGADIICYGLMVAYDGTKKGPVQYERENNVIQYGG